MTPKKVWLTPPFQSFSCIMAAKIVLLPQKRWRIMRKSPFPVSRKIRARVYRCFYLWKTLRDGETIHCNFEKWWRKSLISWSYCPNSAEFSNFRWFLTFLITVHILWSWNSYCAAQLIKGCFFGHDVTYGSTFEIDFFLKKMKNS